MSASKLSSITIERFKSFEQPTELKLSPLTVILGRNNSGKSSLIQSLLLLKQTLRDPRADLVVGLEGLVDSFNLREITHGWPAAADTVEGPTIDVEWVSKVDVRKAEEKARWPDLQEVARNSQISWLQEKQDIETLASKIKLRLREVSGAAQLSSIELWSSRRTLEKMDASQSWDENPLVKFVLCDNAWSCYWKSNLASELEVELRHFIPFLLIDRRDLGARHRQRAWHSAYLILFEQPLNDLESILSELHFLGSSRVAPPTLFKAATIAPSEVGASGELAAQLLHRRQNDIVHFLPPLLVSPTGSVQVPDSVQVKSMAEAVNQVMSDLSITAPVNIQEIKDLGFRLMFGSASITHVGRGLNSLLPLIELGLLADPLRFSGAKGEMPLPDYLGMCKNTTYMALEEPEAHLHPKVASRLAHWFVSLAMTNRSLIVETHSDHMVRRLRGLVARAGKGSALEQWLLSNVNIVSVEQHHGRSTIVNNHLTAEGGVAEEWPADFMDEATDEESAIYYAKIDKEGPHSASEPSIDFTEEAEPELETEP